MSKASLPSARRFSQRVHDRRKRHSESAFGGAPDAPWTATTPRLDVRRPPRQPQACHGDLSNPYDLGGVQVRLQLTRTTTLPPVLFVEATMPAELARLVADLSGADPATRTEAAEQLSRLGPEAAPVAVALVRACGDDSEEVRESVVAALEDMGPPKIEDIDLLAALLSDLAADVGYWAATLLGRLEADAAPAVPALRAAVTDAGDGSVRQRAAWALGQIGSPAAPALDALKQAADSDDPRLARLAQRAVERIGG
jgi:HEAT repeat protein